MATKIAFKILKNSLWQGSKGLEIVPKAKREIKKQKKKILEYNLRLYLAISTTIP